MKRLAQLVITALVTIPGSAQCGMTATLEVQNDCHSVSIAVQTNGGNGPYSIVLETQPIGSTDWNYASSYPADADGQVLDQPYEAFWELTERTRVIVTDADGCVAEAISADYQAVTYRIWGYEGAVPECGTIDTHVKLASSVTQASNLWVYSLDGGALNSFFDDWSFPGTGVMYEALSDFTVPPGPHTVDLPGYFEWQQGSLVEVCPEHIAFTTASVIQPTDCGVNFRVRAALAGALPSGSLMNDGLRNANLVPTVEPYSGSGYSYAGATPGASMSPSLLAITGNNAIVDWLVVEVRSASAPYGVLHSRPALLQRDGDLMGLNGESYINAPVAPGTYRIAIRHRNHLGVMSGSRSLELDPTNTLIDLRSISTSVHGTNARVAVGSVQCLWPGDGDGNGIVQYTGSGNDRDLILTAIGGTTPTTTVTNTYSPLDINMDGTIRYTGTNNDRDIILQTIGGVVPTATRVEQVP